MTDLTASQRARYDREWNGWKACETAFDAVRRYSQISRHVVRLAPRTMLDFGCGDGRLARAVKRGLPETVIHGCDLSGAALERAEGIDRRYSVDLNSETLPERDHSFDMVVASEVIEHVVQPDLVVAELSRVIRPGGHLLVTVPNVAFWRFRVQALLGHVPSVTADERHLHSFNADLLRQLVQKAGFEIALLTGLRQRADWLGQVRFELLCDTLLIIGRKR